MVKAVVVSVHCHVVQVAGNIFNLSIFTKLQPFALYTKGKSSIKACAPEQPWKSLVVNIVYPQMSSQTWHIFVSHIRVLSPDKLLPWLLLLPCKELLYLIWTAKYCMFNLFFLVLKGTKTMSYLLFVMDSYSYLFRCFVKHAPSAFTWNYINNALTCFIVIEIKVL